MPKQKTYSVFGVVTGSKFLGRFQANSKEEAIKLASGEASVCLCHQCSDECEDPEIHEIIAEEVND